MDKTQTSPFESAQEFLVMRNLYESAVKQLALKFEVLNSEFNIQYSRSPMKAAPFLFYSIPRPAENV